MSKGLMRVVGKMQKFNESVAMTPRHQFYQSPFRPIQ
jgi:hypothetical protein